MGLVDYSDSEPEDDHGHLKQKSKTDISAALPPLPATFLDLYSSTVRTSTTDDASLHAGRKRVIPHVEGNWPTHVYLEWSPSRTELEFLDQIVSQARHGRSTKASVVHSLLHNDLGVALPLHISLSRPLVLRTEQKDAFKTRLEAKIRSSMIPPFVVAPRAIEWHPNELSSRHFLVLRLTQPKDNQLHRLLTICNDIATEFSLPSLYADPPSSSTSAAGQDQFHISIAWTLESGGANVSLSGSSSSNTRDYDNRLVTIPFEFSAVKIRIGQDVYTIPLRYPRGL